MDLRSRLRALERAAADIAPTCSACGPAPVQDQTVIVREGEEPGLSNCNLCGGLVGKDGEPLGRYVTVITIGKSPANPPPVPGDDE